MTLKIASGASVTCVWFSDLQTAAEVWEERVNLEGQGPTRPYTAVRLISLMEERRQMFL